MTAPDPRDSVERIVAEMRDEGSVPTISHAYSRTLQKLDEWADRLAALPQQAGGEDDPVPLTEWQQLVARAEAAEAALREAEKDAARYRWLRDCDVDGEDAVMVRGEKGRHTDELLSGTSLDAAIDAAIGGTGDA